MIVEIPALVESIPQLRGRGAKIAPLAGGITNRNYVIEASGEAYVLRVAGANTGLLGIDRAREYACAQAAASVGVGPEVIAFLPEHPALLTRFCPGTVLKPENAARSDVLARIVASLRLIHWGPASTGTFCGYATSRNYRQLAAKRGVSTPAELDQALAALTDLERSLGPSGPPRPCHNDLLPSNLIDTGQHMWIIDWEYAAMGDPFFDLGNLAENHLLDPAQEAELLRLYFGSTRDEDLRRLRAMRAVSALREATWGYLQAGVSTLEFDFRGYADGHLKRCLELCDAVCRR
jgi:thiamine kinase-like enzyme